jgi:hypothetical protein
MTIDWSAGSNTSNLGGTNKTIDDWHDDLKSKNFTKARISRMKSIVEGNVTQCVTMINQGRINQENGRD